MRVLAFDVCLGAVSAAAGTLGVDGAWSLLASDRNLRKTGHAEALMPMLADVVGRAGFGFRDLERVVVTVGPGGFTGVRIGIAAARALALATQCSLVGLTSLEALASEARCVLGSKLDGRDLAIAVDAGREMVFWARFPGGEGASPVPQLLTLEDAAGCLGSAPVLVVGSAAVAVSARAPLGSACEVVADLQPDAASFAPLGAMRAPVDVLRPLYLRPPDAKVQTSMVLPRAVP